MSNSLEEAQAMAEDIFDALIVGGGPAGLSCALTLARVGRHSVVCDDGHPRNERSMALNNFPGLDGISPTDFITKIRRNIDFYPEVSYQKSSVIEVIREGTFFKSTLADGKIFVSKKLVLAEGVIDVLPDIPGMQEGWGRSIFQCPYSHGYEYKDERIGVLADGENSFQISIQLLGLTADIVVFAAGNKELSHREREILALRNVEIVEEEVVELVMEDDQLIGVLLESGRFIQRQALFITPITKVRSDLGPRLGCRTDKDGFFLIDEKCKSNINGVFIAGDIANKMHTVLTACAQGAKVGQFLNLELLEEEFCLESSSPVVKINHEGAHIYLG